MGILNDLKKIFFGASAVSKTAKDKTVEFVKDTGEDVMEKSKEFAEKTGEGNTRNNKWKLSEICQIHE